MENIIMFMEKESKQLSDYIERYEQEAQIHLYMDIVESCEGNLFFCLGELNNLFWSEQALCKFVTDVKELYDIVSSLYSAHFTEIIYINPEEDISHFSEKIKIDELLNFEVEVIPDNATKKAARRLVSQMASDNILSFSGIRPYGEIFGAFVSEDKRRALWLHFAKAILYGYENRTMDVSEFGLIFVYSMLMRMEKDAKYTKMFLEPISKSKCANLEQKFFAMDQVSLGAFRKQILLDNCCSELMWQMYKDIFNQWKERLKNELIPITYENRVKDRVVVFTIQFLRNPKNPDSCNAPTRSLLERCNALRSMGKDVYIINTSERYVVNAYSYFPIYYAVAGNYIEEYEKVEELEHQGNKYWFRQIKNDIPEEKKISLALSWIREIKPEYMLCIGPDSIVADICGQVIPCASMAVVFSSLPRTMNKMKILGRKLAAEEKKEYERQGIDVVESRFTFELKPQREHFTRRQFGIPDDCFLLVIVGTRLHSEVTKEFMQMLDDILQTGYHAVFAGYYDNYESNVEVFENVKYVYWVL